MSQPQVVYTDLDGTLLELKTYDHSIAKKKVQQLDVQNIPLIFCSSKTLAEQITFQQKLDISYPMIVENGSGIFIPENYHSHFTDLGLKKNGGYYVFEIGETRPVILKKIEHVKKNLSLEIFGYSDLGKDEISRITGIPKKELTPTLNRQFSETLIKGNFDAPSFDHFKESLTQYGLQCIPGSKFYTVTSLKSDKGKALEWLQEQFYAIYGEFPHSIGIGDSQNDAAMLKKVNQAFLVQRPDGSWADIDIPGLNKIPKEGPRGWNEVIKKVFHF